MIQELPTYEKKEFSEKKNEYCVCIFVINEGQKLLKQLDRMKPQADSIDIVIADGGSSDGSTDDENLISRNVNTLLVKTGAGKLGSQMRMAFSWALERGYKGVVVVDGNGKDGIEAISDFVRELEAGFDHIQGSRFIPGGHHENTPLSRLVGLKVLHVPLMRIASKYKHTDTTNGFRAYSAKLLGDEKIAIFRNVFEGYELHYYLAVEAARNGYRMKEIPVSRVYPAKGPTPTKISPIKGNLNVIAKLWAACTGKYRLKD